jgi:Flp pilus assembly protein TadD
VLQLQRCLELNPGFDNAMTGLAYALAKLGQADKAKIWLEKAIRDNPQNYRAWYQTGLLQAGSSPAGAQAAYEKAIAIQPNFAPGQRELGIALLQQKNYAAAAPHLQRAVALGLDDAHLHNFLGICYSHTNRFEEAVKSYRTALQLDPNLAEAHLNLAFVLQRQHQKRAAEEYKAACQLHEELCSFVPAK